MNDLENLLINELINICNSERYSSLTLQEMKRCISKCYGFFTPQKETDWELYKEWKKKQDSFTRGTF